MLCFLSGAGVAQASPDQASLCENAIVQASQRTGVPQRVLRAISLTETGRHDRGAMRPWPWAINLEGKGFWFDSREEALAFARRSLAAGRTSFDTGCFQVNYRWHGENFSSLEDMFVPDTGAIYAARFLRDLYSETGDWSAAAGAYHSRTPKYSQAYRARFDRILAEMDPLDLKPAEVQIEVAQGEPVRTRSRTKMTRRPLVISVGPGTPGPGARPNDGFVAAGGMVPERVVFSP